MFDDPGIMNAFRVALIGTLVLVLAGGLLNGGSITGL